MRRSRARLLDRARGMRKASTDAEALLWFHLRDRRLANLKFRRQLPLGGYIVDFCCYERRLIVELDGGQHAAQKEYDAERTQYLEQRGFQVIRFWNSDVLGSLEAVLEEIERVGSLSSPHPSPLPSGEGTVGERAAVYGGEPLHP